MLTFILRIVGGALMSFLPTSNRSGILAGIYLVNAVVAPLTVFYGVSTIASFPLQLLLTCSHNSGPRPTLEAPQSARLLSQSLPAHFPSGTSLDPKLSRRAMLLNIDQQRWLSWAPRLAAL